MKLRDEIKKNIHFYANLTTINWFSKSAYETNTTDVPIACLDYGADITMFDIQYW